MAKTKATATPAAPKRYLRVHAEGAQNIHASDAKFSLDAKPDPYVVFVLDNVTHACDHVNDVEPIKYFAWPNAVKDFELAPGKTLADLSLAIHVKDSDTLKDRYIGGTSIPLGPLLGAIQGNVLCKSKLFTLEFADEKFKKRKDSGEVQLTITLIDEDASPPQPAAQTPTPKAALATAPTTASAVQPPIQQAQASEAHSTATSTPAVQSSAEQSAPSKPLEPVRPTTLPTVTPSFASTTDTMSTTSNEAVAVPATEKLLRKQPTGKQPLDTTQAVVDVTAHNSSISAAVLDTPPSTKSQADAPIVSPPFASLPLAPTTRRVTALTIELVAATGLTRPTSLGALFDRRPDPFVVFEWSGVAKASAPLKDVDLKQRIVWPNARLTFDLQATTIKTTQRKGINPTDLVVLVKDENLLKPTFMGGAIVPLDAFVQLRQCDANGQSEWLATPSATSESIERTITLTFSDEKLTKRKPCGELTLRFYFVEAATAEAAIARVAVSPLVETPPADRTTVTAARSYASLANADAFKPPSACTAALAVEPINPLIPAAQPPPVATNRSSDVKLLSIEALCGRNVRRPTASAAPKRLLKALIDRKPDPYVTFELNGETKRCPTLQDVDVAFFEWRDGTAVQVFEIAHRPYPTELRVVVRDDDAIGNDPFMAGARVALHDVWDSAAAHASSNSEAELVRVCPLTFVDEQLTKQKACGELTLRFRWVYADAPLPIVVDDRLKQTEAPASAGTTTKAVDEPRAVLPPASRSAKQPLVGFVVFQNLTLVDSDALIDASLDLYVVVASFPSAVGRTATSRVTATTSVRNNATKRASSALTDAATVEWKGEELAVPAIAVEGNENDDDATHYNLVIELKDKNAITRDTQVAELVLSLSSLVTETTDSHSTDRTFDLMLCAANKSKNKTDAPTKRTVALRCNVQFFPLGCAALATSLSTGIMLTLFLVRGRMAFGQETTTTTTTFGLNVDYVSNQKKRGLLSFGKPQDVEVQTDRFTLDPRDDATTIAWQTCVDVVYSSKQIAAAKDRESLDVDVQLLQFNSKKAPTVLGSVQLNLWPLLTNASTQLATATIRFGDTASMALEFAVATRAPAAQKAQSAATLSTAATTTSDVSALKAAVLVPSGNLHLLVLYAQQLVAPTSHDERADDLDPEVRVSIEPKYIKRKDHPVRAMLKTRPLENAGATPTWNEYLRLEYRLPPPPIAAVDVPVGQAIETSAAFAQSLRLLPSPLVQVGIYDIQVPGERGGSTILGKTEVPLAAFLLSTIDPSAGTQAAITMKLDVHLNDKVTGSLFVEGIFEPLEEASDKTTETETQTEMVRTLCRAIGKSLSAKAKSARSGGAVPINPDVSLLPCAPGRLEIHLVCVRCDDAHESRAMSAHVWLSSCMDDRKEVKSGSKSCSVDGVETSDVVWDQQLTLYARNIVSDLLRIEIVTPTGKPVGSLKLPLAGIQACAAGQSVLDWHALAAPVTTTKPSLFAKALPPAPKHHVMVGIAFFPDQTLFQPLAQSSSGTANDSAADSIVLVRCCRLVLNDSDNASQSRPIDDVMCKFVVIGSDTAAAGATRYQKVTPARCGVVQWYDDNALTLALGSSACHFVHHAVARGVCPMLRIDVVAKRKGGRFPEQLASYEFALVSALIKAAAAKTEHLCTLYSANAVGASVSVFTGVLQVELLVTAASAPQTQSPESLLRASTTHVRTVPGVLCLRVLAGRNLVDVDPNGEQDPFVVTKVVPSGPLPPSSSSQLVTACQTGVSMNSGCHPQWNSPVFYLRVRDVHTDLLRIDVIDSNEEDHLADALIGSLSIAVASLFPMLLMASQRPVHKTSWLETWLPIYAPSCEHLNYNDSNNAGEIRVDYRFLPHDAFAASDNVHVCTSPFVCDAPQDAAPGAVGGGILYFHIVRATHVACQQGMQPAVRLTCSAINFVAVSKAATGSIQNPEWTDAVIEMAWPASEESDGSDTNALASTSLSVSIEIVDLSVRTANASAMAVLTFGFLNVRSFVAHPTALSYSYYALGGGKTSILIGCQFIPHARAQDVVPLQRKQQRDSALYDTNGQLHVKVLATRFDLPCVMDQMLMNRLQTLRFQLRTRGDADCNSVSEQQLEVPTTSFSALIENDGRIDWTTAAAPSDSRAHALLFDCAIATEHVGGSAVCMNPLLVCELQLYDYDATDDARSSDNVAVGELELPIFDFVLLDGHLASSWYPLVVPAASRSNDDHHKTHRLGAIHLELQYLPHMQTNTSAETTATTTAPTTADDQSILSVTVVDVRNVPTGAHDVCVVRVELMDARVETTPSAAMQSAIVWNEALAFVAPPTAVRQTSTTNFAMRLELRDALRTNVLLASCNWLVPKHLIDSNGDESDDDVVLTLQLEPDAAARVSSVHTKAPSEIRLRIQRLATGQSLPVPSLSTAANRIGQFYIRLDAPLPTHTLTASLLLATVTPQDAIRSLMESKDAPKLQSSAWFAMSSGGDVSVLPVDDACSLDKRTLTIALSAAEGAPSANSVVAYVTVDAHALMAAFQSPKTEFYQRLAVQSLPTTTQRQANVKKPTESLAFHLKYVQRCDGVLTLHVHKLAPALLSSRWCRIEVRWLQSKTSWTRSAIGVANAQTNAIEWPLPTAPLHLPYSNERETTAPIMQIVVYCLDCASSTESGVREAFGQLSLLGLLTDASHALGASCGFQVPLTTADASAVGRLVLHLDASFVASDVSFDERMAAEAARKRAVAFELAEGAAALKRSFVTMGGSADASLLIRGLKEHLLSADRDENDAAVALLRARELLQHAADLETDGDLDRLFVAMDVNGDGMLSWDEYVEHMQSLHALAHANATATPAIIASEVTHEQEQEDEVVVDERGNEEAARAAQANGEPAAAASSSANLDHSLAVIGVPAVNQTAAALIETVDEYNAHPAVVVETPLATVNVERGVAQEPVRQATMTKQLTAEKVIAEKAPRQAAAAVRSNERESLPDDVRTSDAPAVEEPRRRVNSSDEQRRTPLVATPAAPTQTVYNTTERVSSTQSLLQKHQQPVLNSFVLDWKVEDVVLWLTIEMELPQYCDAIIRNAVNGKLLLTLTEAELESEIGVLAPLHRRKLLIQISEFQDKFGSVDRSGQQQQQQRAASPDKTKQPRKPQPLETAISETPAFIKREQLMYQEKQRLAQANGASTKPPLKLGGSSSDEHARSLRAATRLAPPLLGAGDASARRITAPQRSLQSESFADAMQDIMESVRDSDSIQSTYDDMDDMDDSTNQHNDEQQPRIAFPLIQIGSVTNTDELFEIVKQRIQHLSRVLQPQSHVADDTWSDFGDLEDDDEDLAEPHASVGGHEQTGLQLVYEAFAHSQLTEISRAKFQDGVASLLQIDVSWHQFDLLFRHLDTNADGKLSVSEFCSVFQRDHLTFQPADLQFLECALVNFAIEKLETQQWTLLELFRAFDRDGGGAISIAEFATLARFLFTKTDKRQLKREAQASAKRSKRLVYLLMSCLDASADRRISLHEFLRFFFVVWSARLMEVQDQLVECEARATTSPHNNDVVDDLRRKKKALRKALRTNFSRPFRDSMRCVDVSMPSPFSGLLSRLQLVPTASDDMQTRGAYSEQQPARQIWQVLEGQTSTSHRAPTSMTALFAESKAKATEDSRKRVQKGKNEVLRTRLTRQREPERGNAVLQTPSARVSLDETAKLKFDHSRNR